MDYRKYHRDESYLENERMFRNIFAKRYGLIGRVAKSREKVLEVGCSTGTFLDLFKETGSETWGVEPSQTAARAEHKGHRITKAFFEKANLPKSYFDLVILNHTLEHMDDPELVLKKAYGLLKKGGVVFVDVPNAGGLGAKVLGRHWPYRLPEEHRWQFTKQSLTKVFKKSGFKVIHFASRSGVFEFADPLAELGEALIGLKKRFFTNLLTFPYALVGTVLKMGDSMSLVGKKL